MGPRGCGEHQRIACVDLPAFPLQVVARQHPAEWRSDPLVIVEEDKPLARILWTNRAARQQRIRPGMKLTQAQALTARLRALVAPPHRVRAAVHRLLPQLLRYSPHVEPESERPGIFWIDPNGLQNLYASLASWSDAIRADLAGHGYAAVVVVGFNRLHTLAIARVSSGTRVLRDPHHEAQLSGRVPLDRLSISPDLRDTLSLLGVHTLAEFLRLDAGDLRARFAEEAGRLHDLASGKIWTPLQPASVATPLELEIPIDPPDDNLTRLLFVLKGQVHALIDTLAARCEAVTALRLQLDLDHAPPHIERVETAAPTLDVVRLLDLVRLRLSRISLAAAVENIKVEVEALRVHPSQIDLLQHAHQRDLAAAARAIARVNAVFGPGTIVRAKTKKGHLPEAQFCWEPIRTVQPPTGVLNRDAVPLIRLLLPSAQPLPPVPLCEPEAWLGSHGAIERLCGPYRISGGWWQKPIIRDYHYIETHSGEILWVYYDRQRRRWFQQGWVE